MSGGGKARTMKRITAALTILGVLLGCTVSLQELREQAPVHAATSPGPTRPSPAVCSSEWTRRPARPTSSASGLASPTSCTVSMTSQRSAVRQ
jgi:hypothetical protein